MTGSPRRDRPAGSGPSKNAHGNVEVPRINLARLGSIHYPILLHRGERNEAGVWLATFRNLPGYLGIGFSEAAAIEALWSMVGEGPVYDVSQARGIEPTPINIRKLIARGQQAADAQEELHSLGTRKDSVLAAVAKNHGLSRNTLTPMMKRTERWDALGGAEKVLSGLPRANRQGAADLIGDPQKYLEENPARARMILARMKFPKG